MSVAQVLGPIGALATHAIAYAQAGWEIFPLRQDKAPIVSNGLYDATTDIDTVSAWWEQHPTALIGCRIPQNHFILDIDPRHGGANTWNLLKETFGHPGQTLVHMSGRGDGGGHIWYINPGGKLSVKRLNKWAQQHDVGHPIADGKRWSAGIDILHHTLRYTILPPSPHPDTGQPYRWAGDPNQAVTEAPTWLLELLEPDNEPPTPPAWADLVLPPRATFSSSDSPAQWYTDNHTWRQILEPHGWRLIKGDGDQDGSQWRHPAATSPVSATTRYGCLFVYSPNTLFEVTEAGDANGYTRFAAYAMLEHSGNLSTAATAVLKQRNEAKTRMATNPAEMVEPVENPDTLPEPSDEVDPETTEPAETAERWLPDIFWNTNPQLEHIRQAAEARRVSPDAVLATILARIAAIAGHTITLPPTPTRMGLTAYTVIAGPPGTGKSAAMNTAKELLPTPTNLKDGLGVGSGEGIIESFFTWETEPNPETGKPQKVKRQTKHAAIFQADEGEILADLGNRSGSTLMPTLRTAYTSGDLGQTNATEERNRHLPALSYVIGFIMGIQPERAEAFLGDAGGGTPQRFLWTEATYPNHPDQKPEWPGPLDWQPPTPTQLEPHSIIINHVRKHQLGLHPDIAAEIDTHTLAVQRGELVLAEDDAHTMLVRLKTAALLALLEGTLDVELDHWAMAKIVVETSAAVRNNVRATITFAAGEKQRQQNERLAKRELHIQSSKEAEALSRATRIVARAVARHTDNGVHDPQGGGCPKRCLHAALGRRYRDIFTIDDVADMAASYDWITERDGRWFLGGSRPL